MMGVWIWLKSSILVVIEAKIPAIREYAINDRIIRIITTGRRLMTLSKKPEDTVAVNNVSTLGFICNCPFVLINIPLSY